MKIAGIMVTNGGPHPPEKWAEQTASQIIDIAESAPGGLLAEARTFRAKIVDILTGHHFSVQVVERGHLGLHGMARHAHPIDPSPHVDDPVAEIVEAAADTSFESHFARPEVQDYIRQTIGNHFATVIDVERKWHLDGAKAG